MTTLDPIRRERLQLEFARTAGTNEQALARSIYNDAQNLTNEVKNRLSEPGIGLSGGRGGIRNVLVGTLLIGILLNGMTIMNIQYTMQNVIRSVILLAAIVLDSLVNPRDEQTEQQGDI